MDPEKRRQEAVTWMVRLPHATPRDQAAFDAWSADAANREAFDEAKALWHLTGPAAERLAERDAASLRPLLAASRPARAGRPGRWLAAATICVALATGGVWLERPAFVRDAFADVATARSERRTITLPDGSTVELEADSALDLAFEAGIRRVRLRRGAAWFAVRPASEPFVVAAAGGEIRVLGTEFGIDLLGEEAVLSVASGRVSVSAGAGTALVLGRGQRVRFGPGGPGPVISIAVAEAAPWREGRLIFHQAPLAEVIQAIARHRPGRIVIADRALYERRVSANLPAGDSDAALDSLRATLGFRQTALTSHLIILR